MGEPDFLRPHKPIRNNDRTSLSENSPAASAVTRDEASYIATKKREVANGLYAGTLHCTCVSVVYLMQEYILLVTIHYSRGRCVLLACDSMYSTSSRCSSNP